jgi:GcrA cell cycle regulator
MSWSEEDVARLRGLHSIGVTFSQIAILLNRTRNSCIGKAHRLGLHQTDETRDRNQKAAGLLRRGVKRKYTKRARTMTEGKVPRLELENAPVIDDNAIPIEQRKTFFELDKGMCKWPVGEPGHPDFFFCGDAAVEDRPYCLGHLARAYGKSPPEKTDRIVAPFDFTRRAA